MAHNYKNAQFNLTNTNKTDVYTCASGSTCLVKNIHTVNYGTGNQVIKGYIYDSSASTEFQIDQHTINAGASQDISDGIIVLETGDILRLEAGSADNFSGTVSILEIT
jgi:hypothetical protein